MNMVLRAHAGGWSVLQQERETIEATRPLHDPAVGTTPSVVSNQVPSGAM